MYYSYTSYYYAKNDGDCEDAFASSVNEQNGVLNSPIRFAIADGVSDSVSSGCWAQQLSKAFCDVGEEELCSRIVDLGNDWIGRLRRYHGQLLPSLYEKLGLKCSRIAINQGKVNVGLIRDPQTHTYKPKYPAATFVGLEIRPDKTWKALAVGDSCLFQIRDNHLLKRYPLIGKFTSNPPQIEAEFLGCENEKTSHLERVENFLVKVANSNMGDNKDADTGDIKDGDMFFLMTDKLSVWFLKDGANQTDAKIQDLLKIETNQEFGEFGHDVVYKACGVDDLTLTIIRFSNSELPKVAELPKLPPRIRSPPDKPTIVAKYRYYAGDKIPLTVINKPLPQDVKKELIDLGADENNREPVKYQWYVDGKEISKDKIFVKGDAEIPIDVDIQIDEPGTHEIVVIAANKVCRALAFESNHFSIEVLERPENTASLEKKG